LTFPKVALRIPPTSAVDPTINKEYAVLISAPIPKRYTNTGTVNIEPPPPISPSEIPIKMDAMYPVISIIEL
jgi:hypothetical protein